MDILSVVLSVIVGLSAVGILGLTKRFKAGTVVGLAVNSLVGSAVLVALTLSNTVILPLNPFNALLTGLLGVPGLAAVFVVARFL